jgi:transposase
MLSCVINRFKVYGPYKRTMAKNQRLYSKAKSQTWKIRSATARRQSSAKRYSLDITHWSALGRLTREISTQKYMPQAFPGVDRIRCLRQDSISLSKGPEGTWRHRLKRRFYRWNICSCKKRGDGVGKTKRGKGTKIMGLTDASGIPIAVDTTSASPHEVTLVGSTLDSCFLENVPEKLIGDRAYDSDRLDKSLAIERGVELIAPHKNNRVKSATQDGRVLRRYRRRWKIERMFAWLQNFRRLVVRYEYHLKNFLAMVQLGCIVILLRRVLG